MRRPYRLDKGQPSCYNAGNSGNRAWGEQRSDVILEVVDLTVSYNGTPALEGISFTVRAGERVAIVGPNGAGKSTLFKAMIGLLPIQAGYAKTSGAEFGFVTQRSMVDWNFPVTVHDVVMMGRVTKMGWLRWQRPRDREIVRRCLEQVGMLDYADRQVGELSGGQQQRVFIARALAQEAAILLMDEPFSGVDAPSREAISWSPPMTSPWRSSALTAWHCSTTISSPMANPARPSRPRP